MLFLIIGGNIPTIQPLFRSKRRPKPNFRMAVYNGHSVRKSKPVGPRHAHRTAEGALLAVPSRTAMPHALQCVDTESEEWLYSDSMG